MNHICMESLSGRLQAIVAPMCGSSATDQLPRTRQDVVETSKQAQSSVSNPRVPPIDTAIASKIRKGTLASPLSGTTLNGGGFDEPSEGQKDGGSSQESKNADEEEETPVKYPIIPGKCRRWEKPESYVMLKFSMKYSDGPCG